MWIIVEDGDIFEGDENHWADCFFTNVSPDTVIGFCEANGWKVEIKDNAPTENTPA